MKKNLTELKIGDWGSVSLDSDLDEYMISRGVHYGEKIEVIRKAPFGDPICVRISDINLCMNLEEAKKIFVRGSRLTFKI